MKLTPIHEAATAGSGGIVVAEAWEVVVVELVTDVEDEVGASNVVDGVLVEVVEEDSPPPAGSSAEAHEDRRTARNTPTTSIKRTITSSRHMVSRRHRHNKTRPAHIGACGAACRIWARAVVDRTVYRASLGRVILDT
jgi:hypothetical protein